MPACPRLPKPKIPERTAGVLGLLLLALAIVPAGSFAQANYVARFKMEKSKYLVGEPVFCNFTIRNTGTQDFVFSYRLPSRAPNRKLESEPNFTITASDGHGLTDPAPRPCGGAQGTVVYGSVTLPPGGTHTERWLLDQWARFTRPGKYRVHAERHLPLKSVDEATHQASSKPAAYALAIDDLTFEISPSTGAERRAALLPYRRALFHPDSDNFAEAFLVAVTLPQPLFLERLQALARAPVKEHRWDRQQALEGMARLGTPAAWQDILNIARDGQRDEALRAYAILLVGERADPGSLPAMIRLLASAPVSLRDDILRALGFFRDERANQLLFEKLHSANASDRVNAILGLRNLESKETIPALLAMLKDPDAQVRQVANFALQSLTGEKFRLSDSPGRSESAAVAKKWHDWWLKHEAGFEPVHQPACHDW
jgi:PBS lyase HEAT-like repeat